MSAPKLPTLWIAEPIVTDDGRAYGLSSGPFPGKVAYVPASALDAATEALRLERAENKRLLDILDATLSRAEHEIACDSHPDHYRRPMCGPCDCELAPAIEALEAAERKAALSPRPGAKESADE